MGNSVMYPLLYTARLDEAYGLARELIGHAVTVQEVEAFALTGIDGLHRYAALGSIAGVNFHTMLRVPASQADGVQHRLQGLVGEDRVQPSLYGDLDIWNLDPAVSAALSGVDALILEVHAEEAPDLVIEQPFLAALAQTDVAQLYWSVSWPEVRERDLRPLPEYDGVELLIHTPSLFSEEWGDTHSVWVHCRLDERAHWAAEKVGRTVLGEGRLGR